MFWVLLSGMWPGYRCWESTIWCITEDFFQRPGWKMWSLGYGLPLRVVSSLCGRMLPRWLRRTGVWHLVLRNKQLVWGWAGREELCGKMTFESEIRKAARIPEGSHQELSANS